MTIIRATTEMATALSQIAFAAKAYWGYPEAWLAHWASSLTITPAFIAHQGVYAEVRGGRPLGFYALVARGAEAELAHLWVQPAQIGTGLGRALFEHAVRLAQGLAARRLLIEADPHAEGFYLHLGATRIGEHQYEIAGEVRRLPVLAYELGSRNG